MKPSEFQVLDLIPQRPPIQMIDTLQYADEHSATGRLFIKESNVFCEKGLLREPGLMEFIAQTAAAYTGYKNKIVGQQVHEGYIGAIKNLVIHDLPPVNREISSEITVENEVVGYTIIIGKVYLDDKILAECEMRILGK